MRKEVKSTKGLRGIAEVRSVGKNWQVRLNGDIYEFGADNAPKAAVNGKWFVSLSGKGDRWYAIGPIDGVFRVTCIGFGGKPGEPPKPRYDEGGEKTYNGKTWFADPSMSMIATLLVLGPKCKGMTTGMFLPYLYVPDETRPKWVKKLGTQNQVDKLERFEKAVGLTEDDDLPASDNVLPAFQAFILSRKAEFDVLIEDGKVTKTLLPGDDGEDEAPAPKAARKAATKTKAR